MDMRYVDYRDAYELEVREEYSVSFIDCMEAMSTEINQNFHRRKAGVQDVESSSLYRLSSLRHILLNQRSTIFGVKQFNQSSRPWLASSFLSGKC